MIGDYAGMKDGDGLLMANFRADRAREILTALLDPGFEGFERERKVSFAAAAGMAEYSAPLAKRMSGSIAEELERFCAGQPLRKQVTAAMLPSIA